MSKKANSYHILFIPSWYPTIKKPVSGIFIQQQVQALRKINLNIGVLFFEDCISFVKKPTIQLEEGVTSCRSSGFAIPKRIRIFRHLWLRKWENLYKHYTKHRGKPDILHAHSFVGGYVAQYLSKKYKIPYIITEHYSGFINGSIPKHWKNDLNSIYENAENIVAVSTPLRQKLRDYTENTIEVIPNIVNTSIFYPAKEKKSSPPLRLITVSGLIKRKNISFLLRVLAKTEAKTTLTIVGQGSLLSRLRREARHLGVQQKLTFVGNLPPKKVAEAMRRSDIFVFASKVETFGIVLAEAMACGLPIITTSCGIAEDLEKIGVVIIVQNEEEMKQSIDKIYHKFHELNSLQSNSTLKSNFSSDIIAQQIQAVYKKILD